MLKNQLDNFVKKFDEGKSYQDAALQSGLAQSDTLAEYWNLLLMERAIRLSKEYFDQLLTRRAA